MMVWGVKHSLARECVLDLRGASDEGIQLGTTQAGYLPNLSICRAYLEYKWLLATQVCVYGCVEKRDEWVLLFGRFYLLII